VWRANKITGPNAAGCVSCRFGRRWPPASVSSIVDIFPRSWCAHLLRLAITTDRHELADGIEKAEIVFDHLDATVRWTQPTA